MSKKKIGIKNFLPHRDPMLMVAYLTHIDDTSAIGVFPITKDCVFTKNNALQEPGLIENAAQVSSAVVGQSFFEKGDLKGESNNITGYISAIKKVTIHKLPEIGDEIITKAKLVSRFDTEGVSICTIEGAIFNNDELIVACTLNFLIHEI
ncbi:ABC transporter permease [uncultured Maribacter sp.]|uniref:ABC transporter permease n=1 Tax=uncultured Maribacter sp. TaxID=431308 RepID=UPI00260F0F72|nr:ABC transporter permease [uncultured Maribacter sp.]